MSKIFGRINEEKLGPPEPYDPDNLDHNDPTKYKIFGGTIWDHVLAALRSSNSLEPLVNLSILLHDIGKTLTFAEKEGGVPSYYGHAEEGLKLVDVIADRLRLSNAERDSIVYAVGHHMKFQNILGMKPSKVAKIVSNDNFDILVAVARADEFARGEKFISRSDFEDIVDRAIEIKEKWGSKTADKVVKLVDGNHVMKLTSLPPGPKVGMIIKNTTDWIIDTGETDPAKIDEYIKGLVK